MTNDLSVTVGHGSGTRYLPLAQVAPLVRREVVIDPAATYVELGVRSFHKGTFHRRSLIGADFSWQDLYRVNNGDLVFSNIMAWEGAVAMAGPQDDGCIGNHRMLTCACDPDIAEPEFLAHYFKTTEGMSKLVAASTGTVARNRTLTARSLGKIEVPMPPLQKQQRVVAHMAALRNKTAQVLAHLAAIEDDAQRLLEGIFHKAVDGAPTRPMIEVAPLVRREVSIDSANSYSELGLKSFYKGTFKRRTMKGSDYSWQDIYLVRARDLIFSNIMAWEKAIAVAPPTDEGCVVNHRMLTCAVDERFAVPGFLWHYFTTDEGFTHITAASPGTVARNKTLAVPTLMRIAVPVPSLETQRAFENAQSKVAALKECHAAIRASNDALLPATLERIFQPIDV